MNGDSAAIIIYKFKTKWKCELKQLVYLLYMRIFRQSFVVLSAQQTLTDVIYPLIKPCYLFIARLKKQRNKFWQKTETTQ